MSTVPPLGAAPTPNFGYKPSRTISPAVWIWAAIGSALVVIPLLVLAGWYAGSAFLGGKKLADAAVHQFHNEFNAGQYEQIIAEADPRFAAVTSHDATVLFLSDVHVDLGDAGAATFASLNMNSSTGDGTTMTCVYNTAFAKGAATETFTWKKQGSALKLLGYRIQSTALPSN
jgi:hypothetical protein